jgi:hypothetical protein
MDRSVALRLWGTAERGPSHPAILERVFLTEEFAVELPDEALMSDEFSTIDGIVVSVARYGNGIRA